MVFEQISEDAYQSRDGQSMAREYGFTPNGNPIAGRWVLRGQDGIWIDFDANRLDLMERNGHKHVGHPQNIAPRCGQNG